MHLIARVATCHICHKVASLRHVPRNIAGLMLLCPNLSSVLYWLVFFGTLYLDDHVCIANCRQAREFHCLSRRLQPNIYPTNYFIYHLTVEKMKQFSFKVFGLLALLLAFGVAKAQNSEPAQQLKELGADVSTYDAAKAEWVATHPEAYQSLEQQNARVAEEVMPWGAAENKANWVAAHPEEYAQYAKSVNDTRVRMSRTEFNGLSAEMQAKVMLDSNIVIID
jgi:hypothetical protein